MRRRLTGIAVGIALSLIVGGVGIPLRSHLAIVTFALVLVIPAIAGVVVGGFAAGLASAAAGFLVYDYLFLPPYYTLAVRNGENWITLGVYAAVVALVSRVVASLDEARAVARLRESRARRLFEISELLLSEQAITERSDAVAEKIREIFGLDSAAIVVEREGELEVIASSGPPLETGAIERLRAEARVPVALITRTSMAPTQTVALVVEGRPIGLLVLGGLPSDPVVRELLPILANQLALALERDELGARARRAEVLEEIDRLRHALMGAVSHDLRTPLATIKVASSTLVESGRSLSPDDAAELAHLVDIQTDRLTRLVSNLLDMTRIEAGVLAVRGEATALLDLITEVIVSLRPALGDRAVRVFVPEATPSVQIDPVLISQVLANLIDNADRLAPVGTPITITTEIEQPGFVTISVIDSGPGVLPGDRLGIFDTFVQYDTGGRSGLGLAISKAFVEAHGGELAVDGATGGGARFYFSVPVTKAGARG